MFFFGNISCVEKVHTDFLKQILHVKKSTPHVMIYGELGRYPLSIVIEKRIISFWPGLGLPRPKAIVVIPKTQPLPKYLRKKRVKVRSTTGHYATKKRPVKITMYLGLDIIIKLKFTTNFDRCAILNVLNYLTKNFES